MRKAAIYEKRMGIAQKVNVDLSHVSGIPCLGIYPPRIENRLQGLQSGEESGEGEAGVTPAMKVARSP